MAHCINISHSEIEPLAAKFNLSKEDVGAVVSLWQENNNEFDKFPTEEEFVKELTPDETFQENDLDWLSESINRPKKNSPNKINRENPVRPNIKNIKNPNISSALTQYEEMDSNGDMVMKSAYIPEIDNANKRYIVSQYFRMNDGKPYYPFTMGNIHADKKRVEMIRKEFNGEKVVVLNPKTEVIEFGPAIGYAMTIGEMEEVYQMIREEKEQYTPDPNDLPETDFLVAGEKKLTAAAKVIQRYENQIRLLKRRISEKSGRRDALQIRIDRIEQLKQKLEDKASSLEVINQGTAVSKEVEQRLGNIEANLSKDLDEDQLSEMMSELQELGATVKSWIDVNDLIDIDTIEDEDVIKSIRFMQGTFSELHNSYIKRLQEATLAYANKVSYRNFIAEDLFAAIPDETMMRRLFLGSYMSKSELVKVVDEQIRRAAYEEDNEYLDKQKELDSWIERLKKKFGTNDLIKISEHFLQYNKKGEWQKSYVSRVSQDWFDKKNELAEQAKKTGEWKKYFKFLEDTTIPMTKEEYEARKSDRKYTNGEQVFDEEHFEKQDKLIERYNKAREEFIRQELEESTHYSKDDGKTFISEELEYEYKANLEDWEKENDPWYKDEKGRIPNRRKYRILNRIDSRFWDRKYDEIMNDPDLKGFYEFLKETIKENDSIIPPYDKKQYNELLGIKKTPQEEYTENKGFNRTLGLLRREALKTVTAVSQSEQDKSITIGGKIYKSIPLGYIQSELSVKDSSKNIFKILEEHTKLALAYKYKSRVEPLANAAQDILEQMEATVPVNTTIGVKNKKNIFNRTHTEKGALSNTIERLRYLVDAELYGRRKKPYDTKGEVKVGNETRGYSFAKIIDSLIKYTYLKTFSVPNIVSPLVNLGVGLGNNYMWAASGVDFNDSSLTWAYRKITPTVTKKYESKHLSKNAETVLTWLVRLRVLPDINEAAYEGTMNWDKKLTILQSKAEYINQGATALAYLRHNKLKDKNGKDVSILDAFITKDGNLIWNEELMGKQSETTAQEIIAGDGHGVNLFRLSEKIHGINDSIHGDYRSPLQIKEAVWGRAVTLYKTWLFSTLYQRFGGVDFDPKLQRDVKGRYRSYFSAQNIDGKEINFKQMMRLFMKGFMSRKAFENLSEVDRINMIRNVRELQIIMILGGLSLFLASLKGDDDDPLVVSTANLMVNLLNKTQADMFFYLNPMSMGQITDNLVPIIGTTTDFMRIGGAVYDTILGEGIYESGPWRNYSKVGVATARALPIAGGTVKVYNLSDKIVDY